MELRPYQTKSIEDIKKYYRTESGRSHFTDADDNIYSYESRRRVILQLSTGAGKTLCFCTMLKSCHAKGSRAIMVVRGAKLVGQASERLSREGVPHGIYQAARTRDNDELIQICSIDTLYRRKVAPPADLIVVDEVHLSGGSAYQWLATQPQYEKTFFLGVSATPFLKTGLAHIGSSVIYPTTFQELVGQGYLVGAKYYAPHKPNLVGVKKTGGDYNSKALLERLNEDGEKRGLYGSLAEQWGIRIRGKKSLLFAVDRAHARDLQTQLSICGAHVGYIDGETPHEERDRVVEDLEKGRLDVVASVGVLTTGVDIPCVDCLIICRPTASHNLWIQILGRGTRRYGDSKTHFDVIDLAGNTTKLGTIEAEMIGQIEPTVNKKAPSDLATCEACYAVFKNRERIKTTTHWLCPICNSELKTIAVDSEGREIEDLDGMIIEYEPQPWEIDLPVLLHTAKQRGYKKGYVFHSIKHRYGEKVAEKAWKRIRNLKRWPIKAAQTNMPN